MTPKSKSTEGRERVEKYCPVHGTYKGADFPGGDCSDCRSEHERRIERARELSEDIEAARANSRRS